MRFSASVIELLAEISKGIVEMIHVRQMENRYAMRCITRNIHVDEINSSMQNEKRSY